MDEVHISKLLGCLNTINDINKQENYFHSALSNVAFPATIVPYLTAHSNIPNNVTPTLVRNISPSCKEKAGNESNDISNSSSSVNSKKIEEKQQISFPERLMQILSQDKISDIVSWLPHGKSFVIYDKKKFVNIILPIFFNELKFTSFTRKLKRWGFERIRKGLECGAYNNEYFKRDDVDLCKTMRCQKKHEVKKKKTPLQSKKENFIPERYDRKCSEKKLEFTKANPTIQTTTTINTNIVKITPSVENLARNQSNYMQLVQLKQQQREINERLQEAIRSASEQPRFCYSYPQLFKHTQESMSSISQLQALSRQQEEM